MTINVNRQNPFLARIIERERLTPIGDEKQTFHISLSIRDEELPFKVGDSIGVYGQNNPNIVKAWLIALGATGQEEVSTQKIKGPLALQNFLTHYANLSRFNSSLFKHLLKIAKQSAYLADLTYLLEEDRTGDLSKFLKEHEPLDLLKHCTPGSIAPQELCEHLAPLLPRFYSIASSTIHAPHQIDLVVAHLSYHHRGEERFGVASHFLCHLAEEGTTAIPIYVQASPHFTLPANDDVPMIMIGPGTGVAPFRAFLQERIARGAKGKHWLFFGERKRSSHFYYGNYWADLEQKGLLQLSTAFSRDQQEKIYVQHRMMEQKQILWQWIQEGAIIYVCGDAEKMAKQVESCFLSLFSSEGGLSEEHARAFLQDLRKQKRYLADVY